MHIKETWKEHPLYKEGKIELVPIEWVLKYCGHDVPPDIGFLDGTSTNMDELWESILKVGLSTPFIMRVGLKNKKFRLETGNHRIQLFQEHGVRMIPVTVQVREECGPHVKDVLTKATHNFDAPNGFLISEITDEYMAPSQVFPDLKP